MSRNALGRVWARLTGPTALAVYSLTLTLAAFGGGVYLSYRLFGLFDTVVYTVLFLGTLTFLPAFIGLFGGATPMTATLSKLHILFGQVALGTGYLVDMGDEYQWCTGTRERVYIDGEWHDIEGGHDNRSVLGWRPFAILRYKDEETLLDVRSDSVAEVGRTTSDGGTVERAGFAELGQDAISGDGQRWELDLKRVFSRGIRKMGDIELIETAEEVAEREEAKKSRVSGYEPIIASAVGIVLGAGIGWVML